MSDRPSTEIQPALIAEDWAEIQANVFAKDYHLRRSCDSEYGNDHVRAALSLYGKPYGFTHEDVEALHHALDNSHQLATEYGGRTKDGGIANARELALYDRALRAVEKLAALLPPTP